MTTAQREAVNVVVALSEGSEEESRRPVGIRQVARQLGIDRSAAHRRLARAAEKGYVINLEDQRGRPARFLPGDALPDSRPAIPTPERLEKASAGMGTYPSENHSTTAQVEQMRAPDAPFQGVQGGVQAGAPAQPAAQVKIPVQLGNSRDLCSGAADPREIDTDASPPGAPLAGDFRSTLPPFEDDDRRAVVLRMGENLAYKKFEFKRGHAIAEGEEYWRTFAATASSEDINLVLRALETYRGPSDG